MHEYDADTCMSDRSMSSKDLGTSNSSNSIQMTRELIVQAFKAYFIILLM